MVNRSNTLQAFWVATGSLSALALGLISAAILSRYFNKTEYGTYRQILYVYNTLLIVFTAGLPRVFSYYLPRYSIAHGKIIVWKISKIMFIGGLFFSLFIFLFSGIIADILRNPELSRGLKVFSPVPILLLPTLGIEGVFATYQKTIFIAIYNTISRILMLVFIVAPVIIFKGTYLYALYGWIIVSVLTLILAYFFKNIPFKGVKGEDPQLPMKEILGYSLPIAFAGIAGMIENSANQFYISRYFGTEVFAEFSNGFIQIPFVSMITGATATVLSPVFARINHEGSDLNQLSQIWQSSLNKSIILIYPIVFFCLLYPKEIMIFLFSETYYISAKYFSAAILMNLFNVITFGPLLLSVGESRLYANLQISSATCTWLFGYLAVNIFGTPLSVAIVSVIVALGYYILAFYFTSKKIRIGLRQFIPLDRILVIALHSIICAACIKLIMKLLFPNISIIFILLVSGLLYTALLISIAPWFKIQYKEIIYPLFHKLDRSTVKSEDKVL